MEYYPALQKNEMLPFATTWMDLKGIMLNKLSLTEKDKNRMISLTCGIFKKKKKTPPPKLINTENRLLVSRGGKRESEEWVKRVKDK